MTRSGKVSYRKQRLSWIWRDDRSETVENTGEANLEVAEVVQVT